MILRNDIFMITCAARTGSTLLVNLLRSHPDIMCYGELYGIPTPTGIAGRYKQMVQGDPQCLAEIRAYRDSDHQRFLYKIAFDSQDRKLAGFKFKYDELDLRVYSTVARQIKADTDIKIVHLLRRNLLSRYLSHHVAQHVTGITLRVQGQDSADVPPVILDPKKCKRDFDKAVSQQKKYADFFSRHQVFTLCYEDLLEEPTRTDVLGKLLDFLEVPTFPLSTVTRKLAQKPIEQAIANYSDLRKYFSGSHYAYLF